VFTTVLTVLGLSLVFGVGVPALAASAARVAAPELTTADGGTAPARPGAPVRIAGAVALVVTVVAVVGFAVWLVATGGTK